jgi:hypothetical protein
MGQRSTEWHRRQYFPSTANARLGWGAEYWDLDPTHYEGWSELRDRHAALGRRRANNDLAVELSDHLLDDVLVAAGGVEHAIESLRSAVAELKGSVAEHGLQATTETALGLGHEAATEAWYAYADVISWARMLEERLDRPARPRSNLRRQGLVPALKPARLTNRVRALLDQLRRGPVGETRYFANFTLHAALVRHPLSGAVLDPSGAVRLPIPDPPGRRVAHWYLLTWSQGRDGITFAEELWQSIQDFVDALLDAFENAVPKRLRRT